MVNSPQDTLVLTPTFKASTPEKARAGAQAFADAYLDYRQSQYDKAKQTHDREHRRRDRTLNAELDTANAQLAAAPPNSDAATNALSQISVDPAASARRRVGRSDGVGASTRARAT